MKAPPFAYVRAATLDQVFELWSQAGGEAKLIAGGQSLLPALAFRLSEPTRLVDISRIAELQGIVETPAGMRIGALTTHAEIGRNAAIKALAPLLAEAAPLIAHPAIRNRGTIGGSLAFADPAAELPACCVALDARIIARSAAGERAISADDFFTGLYATALGERELIAAIEVPRPSPGMRTAILEVARRSGDYAMAGIAARLDIVNGACANPRLVFFGVGDVPVRARRAEAAIVGTVIDAGAIARAQDVLAKDLDPPADLHGGPAMKRHLAGVLLRRALARLATKGEARAA